MMEGESKKSRDRTPSKPLLESIETQESPDQSSDSDTESADPTFKCIPCLRLFNTDAELKKHERTQTHQKKVDNTVRRKKEASPRIPSGASEHGTNEKSTKRVRDHTQSDTESTNRIGKKPKEENAQYITASLTTSNGKIIPDSALALKCEDWDCLEKGEIPRPKPAHNSIVFCVPCEKELQNDYSLDKHVNGENHRRHMVAWRKASRTFPTTPQKSNLLTESLQPEISPRQKSFFLAQATHTQAIALSVEDSPNNGASFVSPTKTPISTVAEKIKQPGATSQNQSETAPHAPNTTQDNSPSETLRRTEKSNSDQTPKICSNPSAQAFTTSDPGGEMRREEKNFLIKGNPRTEEELKKSKAQKVHQQLEKLIFSAQLLHPNFELKENAFIMISIIQELFPEIPMGRNDDWSVEDVYGKKIAQGIERILLGDHGPYVEFTKPEATLRGGETSHAKFFRLFFSAEGKTRVYHQLRKADMSTPPAGLFSTKNRRIGPYADYRPGYYYVSLFECQLRDKAGISTKPWEKKGQALTLWQRAFPPPLAPENTQSSSPAPSGSGARRSNPAPSSTGTSVSEGQIAKAASSTGYVNTCANPNTSAAVSCPSCNAKFEGIPAAARLVWCRNCKVAIMM